MYVKVSELPDCLQKALSSVGYHRPDISVVTAEHVSLFDAGSSGRRGFVILVNLSTGEQRTTLGSWGGSNAYNPHNAVDLDTNPYDLPENGAVIRGSEGDGPVLANLYLNPKNIAPWLPSVNDVTSEEKEILAQFRSLKPAYRNITGKETIVQSLVSRGYLKRNKVGATQITTEGKNACSDVR